MATVLLAALLGGCSFLSKEADATEASSKAETESPGATQESETETAETEETQESHEAAEDEESGEEETEDHFVEKKIVVATDMHYFAEKLAGNRCDSFVGMARGGDGRVLEYGWEVMDAFLFSTRLYNCLRRAGILTYVPPGFFQLFSPFLFSFYHI